MLPCSQMTELVATEELWQPLPLQMVDSQHVRHSPDLQGEQGLIALGHVDDLLA